MSKTDLDKVVLYIKGHQKLFDLSSPRLGESTLMMVVPQQQHFAEHHRLSFRPRGANLSDTFLLLKITFWP